MATMPLIVRTGFILPYGPGIEYAAQSVDTMELCVLKRRGLRVRVTIPISWDEKSQALTIGWHKGKFHGMLQERTFRIVFISLGQGAGVATEENPDAIIHYAGKAV
jgi:alpha-D-xyloside xylohydrolase